MKKVLLTAALMVMTMILGSQNTQAQSQFRKGDFAINLDYCLGSDDNNGGNATNGFSLLGEHGFMNVINEKGTISVGLLLGAGFNNDDAVYYDDEYSYSQEYKFSRIRIGTRGTLHYSFIPQLDTYGGLNFLFVDIEKVKIEERNGSSFKDTDCKFVAPSLVAGVRYMFCPAFGVNFETSWDRFQHISVGMTFKF